MSTIFAKLAEIEQNYEEMGRLMADPELLARQEEWQQLAKDHAGLEPIADCLSEAKKVEEGTGGK